MKKLSILTGILAIALLAGCTTGGGGGKKRKSSTEPSPTDTTQPTQTTTSRPDVPDDVATRAIELAKQYDLAMVNGATGILEGVTSTIGEDANHKYKNDYVSVVTQQLVFDDTTGDDVQVFVDWEYDASDTYIKEVLTLDEAHKGIFFSYNETEHDFPFKAVLKCGKKSAEMNYQVHLMVKNLIFANLTIADIYKVNSTNDGFDLVDPATGFYKPNNEGFTFTCVSTQGVVEYVSPDGNWALISDNGYVLELYSGSALDLNPTRYPALKVGNSVYVEAELGCYFGNLQISFIFDISQDDTSRQLSGYQPLSGADFDGKHYWENQLMNSLRTVNATIKTLPASIKNERFTFEIEVDGKRLAVAYDYHVDRNGDVGVFDAFKAKLESLSVGSSVTIKGTFRFAGDVQKGYKGNENMTKDKAYWNIVPFLADHIA